MKIVCLLIVCVAFPGEPIRAADLELVPLSAFGRLLTECRVDRARYLGSGDKSPRDLRDHFSGLKGQNLPLGRYDIAVYCGESFLNKQILLSNRRQTELIVRIERIMISDHTKPELVIKMDPSPAAGGTWWVSLLGVYNGVRETSAFDNNRGGFVLIDPQSGSYFLTVESEKGNSCAERVDFIEFTRLWTFHPTTCSLDLDEYARLVRPRSGNEPDPWYQEMKDRVDNFFKDLLESGASVRQSRKRD